MQRELILFSYGTADMTVEAFHKPLKASCKLGAQLCGSWLQQQDLIPDQVICSTASPAQQSAEYACNVMGLSSHAIRVEERIHSANRKSLLALLGECPTEIKRLLLVAHSTLLEKLMQNISSKKDKRTKAGKILPATSMAVLQLEGNWSELDSITTSLKSLTHADKLPKKFPFITQDQQLEWRDRPAYYYSQSAVIPYRIHKGRAEVMLITSSNNKHWIIPKGVIEIGMSAEDSAAKEAFEEAGVRGRVSSVLLGTYEHNKWGASCDVQVYPLQVSEVIPQSERLEPHRQRRWVTPLEASLLLRQKSVISMIFRLAEQLMLTGNP